MGRLLVNVVAIFWAFGWAAVKYRGFRAAEVGLHPLEMLGVSFVSLVVWSGPLLLIAFCLSRWVDETFVAARGPIGPPCCARCGYPAEGLRTTTCPECRGRFTAPRRSFQRRCLSLALIMFLAANAGAFFVEALANMDEITFRQQAAAKGPGGWSRERWWPLQGRWLFITRGKLSVTG